MKYYSEKLDKMFVSEDALNAAEKATDELNKKKLTEKEELSKSKRDAAKRVEQASKDAQEARCAYKQVEIAARQKYTDAVNTARNELRKTLVSAYKTVTDASNTEFQALKEFNEKYGPYTTTYTTHDLTNMFDMVTWFSNLFDRL